ncbi:hypothetical protein [Aeromonas veronii]|uniref:hypothetical protein n=1 Tax=Aeromonas veronii TaxID=654 RepID=UPI001C5BF3E8|nr:hypothetical protein [Aeromonas veronii]
MKQYQNWLAHYLVCRRDGDHAMAADLAESIVNYWRHHGNTAEEKKWASVVTFHLDKVE